MIRSFYQYLMTLRNPDGKDEISHFANSAFYDLTFPKQAEEYSEISEYLELNGSYLPSMDIFDEVYRMYIEKNTR
ncbi:YozE family protein [Companilactobacillus sp. DQM5]|uniref:YozE family protein n=1 Tax=Companilactobacillus sp. DQM5 TaxID=3463359 RepID=UPI004058ECFB